MAYFSGEKMNTHRITENGEKIATYRIEENGEAITCLICGRTSHNLNDVSRKYCGFCHIFHGDIPKGEKLPENEYRCEACGRIFPKGRSDEEARKEYVENFGVGDELPALVCDDCFKTMTAIIPPPLEL
jgi:hypothetical protein